MNPEQPQNNVPPTIPTQPPVPPTAQPVSVPIPQAPAVPQPQYAQPQIVTPEVSGSKTLAIITLIVAILGFLTGFILIGYLLAVVALILSIVGLVKRKPGKGLNIASVIISGVCLLTLPFMLYGYIAQYDVIQERANQAVIEAEAREAAE